MDCGDNSDRVVATNDVMLQELHKTTQYMSKKSYTKFVTAHKLQLCGFTSGVEALFLASFWYELRSMNTNKLSQWLQALRQAQALQHS